MSESYDSGEPSITCRNWYVINLYLSHSLYHLPCGSPRFMRIVGRVYPQQRIEPSCISHSPPCSRSAESVPSKTCSPTSSTLYQSPAPLKPHDFQTPPFFFLPLTYPSTPRLTHRTGNVASSSEQVTTSTAKNSAQTARRKTAAPHPKTCPPLPHSQPSRSRRLRVSATMPPNRW